MKFEFEGDRKKAYSDDVLAKIEKHGSGDAGLRALAAVLREHVNNDRHWTGEAVESAVTMVRVELKDINDVPVVCRQCGAETYGMRCIYRDDIPKGGPLSFTYKCNLCGHVEDIPKEIGRGTVYVQVPSR